MRESWMELKQQRQKASGESAAEQDREITLVGDRVKALETEVHQITTTRDEKASGIEKNESQIAQLGKEIKGYETMLQAENRKLVAMQSSYEPLEEKYQSIVSALAHTIIRFKFTP